MRTQIGKCTSPGGTHDLIKRSLECPYHAPLLRMAGGLPDLPPLVSARTGRERYEAEDPNLTPERLIALADDHDPSVRYQIASRDDTPVSLLAELSADWHSRVRGAVAKNPRTPAYVLRTLLGDEDRSVRVYVMSNPALTLDVLEEAVASDDPAVQAAAARRTIATPDMLRALVRSENPQVAKAAMRNKNADEDVFHAFMSGPHGTTDEARMSALETEYVTDDMINAWIAEPDSEYLAKAVLARDTLTEPTLLAIAALPLDAAARKRLAEHPSMTPALAAHILDHHSARHLYALAWNQGIGADIARRLWDEKRTSADFAVVLKHLAANAAAAEDLITEIYNSDWARQARIRVALASNPSAPEAVVRSLAQSKSTAVWEQLASNPASPGDIIARAMKHEDETVRARAHDGADTWIVRHLGVSPDNDRALAHLKRHPWWTLSPESALVVAARRLFAN